MAVKAGGMYEYKSVFYQFTAEPPPNLLCSICFGVCSNPHQATCCGKVFCFECIEKVKASNNVCPCCRQATQTFPDKRTEQDVGNLWVLCPNEWCKRHVELLEIENHRLACISDQESIECRFSSMGCPKKGSKEDIEKHMKEDVVLHLDLCRKCFKQLTSSEKSSTAPSLCQTSSNATEIVSFVQPKVRNQYTILIPVDQYEIFRKTYSTWNSVEFPVAEWTFKLQLAMTNATSIVTVHHIYLNLRSAPGKAENVRIIGNILAYEDETCKCNVGTINQFDACVRYHEYTQIGSMKLRYLKSMFLKLCILYIDHE